MQTSWQRDVLGDRFEQCTLPLGDDFEGEVVATLVRHRPRPRWLATLFGLPLRDVDVLYTHGWSDYFFQRELAEFFTARGARFFALDLRKYGRSLRPHQTPGFTAQLSEYDADIEAALGVMGSGNRRVFLLGHSLGGLVFSLWAHRNPGRVDALILNSPWLETQGSTIARILVQPVFRAQAMVSARSSLPNIDLGYYSRTIDRERDGEWEFNHEWRPPRGFVAKPAWGTAVVSAHRQVAAGLTLDVPVLTLLSRRSLISPVWREGMLSADSVLVVDDIARRALNLGSTVTVARIDRALHDVFLSAPAVRAEAYRQLDHWLRGYSR